MKLIVTSGDPAQVTKLKALGFMGIMVQGGHHQPHHLMMAKGEFVCTDGPKRKAGADFGRHPDVCSGYLFPLSRRVRFCPESGASLGRPARRGRPSPARSAVCGPAAPPSPAP